jgi:ribokinase
VINAPNIVVIGSINMDLVVHVPRLPVAGETLAGSDLQTFPGGKGANQAVAAARLGAKVHMVGRIGDDAFGRTMRDNLHAAGVNTRYVKITQGSATGTAVIFVLPAGDNSILISPGANAALTPGDVDAAMPIIRRADFVLLQLEIPLATVRHALRICRREKIKTMLDPAPAPKNLPRDVYHADFLTPNETEAAALLHSAKPLSPPATMTRLRAAGAKTVVLKLGSRGAICGPHHIPAFKIKPIDTTAAGDCFNAAFAIALAEKQELPDALRFANAAAAIACTIAGAQASLPNRNAVEKMLKRIGHR